MIWKNVSRIWAYPKVIALYRNACPMNSDSPSVVRRGYCSNITLRIVQGLVERRCCTVID